MLCGLYHQSSEHGCTLFLYSGFCHCRFRHFEKMVNALEGALSSEGIWTPSAEWEEWGFDAKQIKTSLKKLPETFQNKL